jgi:hypothetical protein
MHNIFILYQIENTVNGVLAPGCMICSLYVKCISDVF